MFTGEKWNDSSVRVVELVVHVGNLKAVHADERERERERELRTGVRRQPTGSGTLPPIDRASAEIGDLS